MSPISFPSHLLACTVCWGGDGSSLGDANAAVLFMLVVLVGVLGSFLGFILYLAKRAKRVALEDESEMG